MNSRTTHSFREAFRALPPDVKERARKAYRLWRDNSQFGVQVTTTGWQSRVKPSNE